MQTIQLKNRAQFQFFICSHLKLKILVTLLFSTLLIEHTFAQVIYDVTSECENHNSFAKNGKLDSIQTLVIRTRHDGTIYLDPDKIDSLPSIFRKLGVQSGSSFQATDVFESIADTLEYFQRYQQYYNGVKVSGGGYTMAFNRPGGPEPCIDFPSMVMPYIKTGITVNTAPDISSEDALDILNLDGVLIIDTQLVISHNLNRDCQFNLTWSVVFQKQSRVIALVDAHSGDILSTNVVENDDILAPTYTYEDQTLDDRDLGTTRTLQSPDERISVYDFHPGGDIDETEWTSNHIPSTTSDVEWTTEALPEVYQLFFVATSALPIFEGFGKTWGAIHLASNTTDRNVFSYSGSTIENAFFQISRIDNVTAALRDVVGHEMGHTFLNQFFVTPGTNTATHSMHEGLSDIIGTYIEYRLNALDWVMGDDESVIASATHRDLENPEEGLGTYPEVKNLISTHDRSVPLGHWFYLITEGDNDFEGLGIELAFSIVINSLPALGSGEHDYPDIMNATLNETEKRFGVCSDEFLTVARAWEQIGVPTGYPKYHGLVTGCDYYIDGPNAVCEEDDGAEFCIAGGLIVTNYRFTIIGPKSTEYDSYCGMVGNSQSGCSCLTLTDFPKYPYYPQFITIEAYYEGTGAKYVTRKRVKLVDCLGDDPTCREYYDLDPYQSHNPIINEFADNGLSSQISKMDSSDLSVNDKENLTITSMAIYDILGRNIYKGDAIEDLEGFVKTPGVVFVYKFDKLGQLVSVDKKLIFK